MASARAHDRFLLLLLTLAIVVVLYEATPFLTALLLAAVLATTAQPLASWLARRLGGRPSLAAALVVFLAVVAILGPLSLFVSVLVRQVLHVTQSVIATLQNDGVDGLVARLPHRLQGLAQRALEDTPEARARLANAATRASAIAAGIATGLLQRTGSALLQTLAMLVALFLFLTRGGRLLHWLEGLSPLGPLRTRHLFEEMQRVSVSVIGSTVLTAAIQTLVAFAGYLVARVPNAVLLAFLTFFTALVPALGATIFVIAVAVVFFLTGHLVGGLVLGGWAVLVAFTAQALTPYFISKYGARQVDGGAMLFALIGGAAVFGAAGIVIGPLSLALLLALTRMYSEEEQPPPRAQ